ncbi:MAG: lipopolysaccharide kinase InaA family protein, partial [Planctomycetaceae bacterium]
MPLPAAATRVSRTASAAARAANVEAARDTRIESDAGDPNATETNPRPDAAGGLVPHRAGSMRWRIEAASIPELFDGPRLRVAELFETGRAGIIKTGPHRTVHRLALASGCCYLKHYRVTDWAGLLHNVFRPCKAEREEQAARRAADLGVRTYEIRGIGRVVAAGLVRDSYLLTKEVADAIGLDVFVTEALAGLPEARRTRLGRQVARRAGELTARLHQGGFLHRDYHSENLLVEIDGSMRGPLEATRTPVAS